MPADSASPHVRAADALLAEIKSEMSAVSSERHPIELAWQMPVGTRTIRRSTAAFARMDVTAPARRRLWRIGAAALVLAGMAVGGLQVLTLALEGALEATPATISAVGASTELAVRRELAPTGMTTATIEPDVASALIVKAGAALTARSVPVVSTIETGSLRTPQVPAGEPASAKSSDAYGLPAAADADAMQPLAPAPPSGISRRVLASGSARNATANARHRTWTGTFFDKN